MNIKTTLILMLAVSASSCSMLMDEIVYSAMSDMPEYYMEEWEDLSDFHAIGQYIKDHVKYESDGLTSKTQPPEATMSRGKGDCEDFALLFMNIANVALGVNMDLVVTDKPTNRTVDAGGIPWHVAVRYNGKVYEPQNGYQLNYEIRYSYTYQEVFR